MTGLLRAELRRITSRRLMRVAALVVLGIVALVLVRNFATSHRDTAAQRETRRTEQIDDFVRQCERENARNPEFQQDCSREQFQGFPGEDRRLTARRDLGNGVIAVAGGLMMVGFFVGASAVGADWTSGAMQALLFWEPRRGRVLLAKAIAVVVALLAFTLLLQALVYGATYLTAATRGSTEGVTSGLHMSNLLRLLRASALVPVTGLIGFALAGLARHSVAAVGTGFGYLFLGEIVLRGLRPGWHRWLLIDNIRAVTELKAVVPRANGGHLFDVFGNGYVLTAWRGAATLALYLAILLGGFYLSFTRRDVT